MVKSVGGVPVLPTHRLSCHCGSVVMEVDLPDGIVDPRRCNCSMCRRKGTIVGFVLLSALRLIQGQEHLRMYQFNTKVAKHYFCGVCGINTHHQRRLNPNEYTYNVGCLEGIDPFLLGDIPVFDGAHHPLDRNPSSAAQPSG
jgi:hypothetical protein